MELSDSYKKVIRKYLGYMPISVGGPALLELNFDGFTSTDITEITSLILIIESIDNYFQSEVQDEILIQELDNIKLNASDVVRLKRGQRLKALKQLSAYVRVPIVGRVKNTTAVQYQ